MHICIYAYIKRARYRERERERERARELVLASGLMHLSILCLNIYPPIGQVWRVRNKLDGLDYAVKSVRIKPGQEVHTHTYIYTYIHVHMYVCTWVISLTCSRRRAGVRIHILSVCTLISTYIYMQVKLLTPIWRRSGVIRSICTLMYTHIYIYTYVYVYIYINI